MILAALYWLLSLAVFTAGVLAFEGPDITASCINCHSPTDLNWTIAPTGNESRCSHCHIQNKLLYDLKKGESPLASRKTSPRFPWFLTPTKLSAQHSYIDTPALDFLTEDKKTKKAENHRPIRKYTRCGIRQFLTHPVPRHFSSETSMFPLTIKQVEQVEKRFSESFEDCMAQTEASLLKSGSSLYKNRCLSCHNPTTGPALKAPRLRLGVELLSFTYFVEKIKNGATSQNLHASQNSGFHWIYEGGKIHRQEASKMPTFPNLSQQDLKALFTYISISRKDLPTRKRTDKKTLRTKPKKQGTDTPVNYQISLYENLQNRIFKKSCRHCHSEGLTTSNLETFGRVPKTLFPIKLSEKPAPSFLKLLNSCTGGQKALLVHLNERKLEVQGHGTEIRGMPMTQPPVDNTSIKLLKTWIKLNCPTPNWGNLCKSSC